VDQAVKIVEEYNHLTRHGRTLSARGEIADGVATEEPHEIAARQFEHSRTPSFGKKQSRRKREPETLHGKIEKHDMMFGIGPGGTGKNIHRRWSADCA